MYVFGKGGGMWLNEATLRPRRRLKDNIKIKIKLKIRWKGVE